MKRKRIRGNLKHLGELAAMLHHVSTTSFDSSEGQVATIIMHDVNGRGTMLAKALEFIRVFVRRRKRKAITSRYGLSSKGKHRLEPERCDSCSL